MNSRTKVRRSSDVGKNRGGSKRLDRKGERGYNENDADENDCCEASDMVSDASFFKDRFFVVSHTGDVAHCSDRGCVYLLSGF